MRIMKLKNLKWIGGLLLGAALAAGAALLLHVHVIRMDNDIKMLWKARPALKATYVDVRHITVREYVALPLRVHKYLLVERQWQKMMDHQL